jgi:hypothetical protein
MPKFMRAKEIPDPDSAHYPISRSSTAPETNQNGMHPACARDVQLHAQGLLSIFSEEQQQPTGNVGGVPFCEMAHSHMKSTVVLLILFAPVDVKLCE